MRDILFRGKCVNKEGRYRGAWLEGDFVYHNGMNPHKGYIYHRVYHPATGDYPTCHFLPVDPKTVGQFTGLCDKNGSKIFEGDIVRAMVDYGPAGMIETIVTIRFEPSVGGYQWNYFDVGTMEVIGNIYDNPELLKGE